MGRGPHGDDKGPRIRETSRVRLTVEVGRDGGGGRSLRQGTSRSWTVGVGGTCETPDYPGIRETPVYLVPVVNQSQGFVVRVGNSPSPVVSGSVGLSPRFSQPGS